MEVRIRCFIFLFFSEFALYSAFAAVCLDHCNSSQFHCSRGRSCISAGQECDGYLNCNDTSDEAKCCKFLHMLAAQKRFWYARRGMFDTNDINMT